MSLISATGEVRSGFPVNTPKDTLQAGLKMISWKRQSQDPVVKDKAEWAGCGVEGEPRGAELQEAAARL